MSHTAIDTYLNDHLAGAVVGSDLAKQLRQRHEGTPLGELMGSIAPEIEEDRHALVDLMKQLDVSRDPIKVTFGFVAEMVSRVKLGSAGSDGSEHATFTALEALTLGVEGKASMWKALKVVQAQYPPLASTDFDALIARAQSQHDALEQERLALGERALGNVVHAA
jgi:hypothetical protein